MTPTATKTANYTAVKGDFVRADASGGAFTVTLPASPANGDMVGVKKEDSSVNVVTVAPASGTIDGDATASIVSQYAGAIFIYDGTNWEVYAPTQGLNAEPTTLYAGKLSGLYYVQASQAVVGSTNQAEAVGVAYAVPIWLHGGITLDRIGATHGTNATAAETMRLGIYKDNGSQYPGALLLDAGTIDLSTATGFKTITISQAIARSGLYWLVGVRQGGSAVATILSQDLSGGGAPTGLAALPVPTADISARGAAFVATGVTGALPGTWSATVITATYQTASSKKVPWIAVRVA